MTAACICRWSAAPCRKRCTVFDVADPSLSIGQRRSDHRRHAGTVSHEQPVRGSNNCQATAERVLAEASMDDRSTY